MAAALLCLGLLWFSREASYANLATLPSELLLPGQGGQYGVWYVSSLILTGVIGSLLADQLPAHLPPAAWAR